MSSPTIAVIAPNWLGDAVMSLPLVGLLIDAGARVAVLASPYVHRVYWSVDAIDELIVDKAGSRAKRIVSRSQWLHALGPAAVVVTPPSFSSALPGFLAGVRHRIGAGGDGRSLMLTDVVTPSRPRENHLASEYESLGIRALQRIGLGVPERGVVPAINVLDSDRRAAAELRVSWQVGERYAVIVPGATFGPAKSWPWERFRQLAGELADNVPVIVAGNARERGLCARVADGLKGVFVAAGQTSLGAFFALLAEAGVVIANDSGAPHAAASVGAPVVVLFGSTSPEWTAPQGANVTVVQHKVHCNPCFRRTCPTQLECFAGISVDDVVRRAHACLNSV